MKLGRIELDQNYIPNGNNSEFDSDSGADGFGKGGCGNYEDIMVATMVWVLDNGGRGSGCPDWVTERCQNRERRENEFGSVEGRDLAPNSAISSDLELKEVNASCRKLDGVSREVENVATGEDERKGSEYSSGSTTNEATPEDVESEKEVKSADDSDDSVLEEEEIGQGIVEEVLGEDPDRDISESGEDKSIQGMDEDYNRLPQSNSKKT
ncbi:hypothetical protein U1Q18_018125 [Sarracenia purpurea var. burkii]